MKKHRIHYIWAAYIVVTLSISFAFDWSLWLQAGIQGIGALIYFFWPTKPTTKEVVKEMLQQSDDITQRGVEMLTTPDSPHNRYTKEYLNTPVKSPVIHKYIIYDGDIRHALVEYHSQLIPRPDGQTELVRGGGRICFMPETRELLFYSLSTDFGYVDYNVLKEALERHRWSARFKGYCVYYSDKHELSDAKIKQSLIHQIP